MSNCGQNCGQPYQAEVIERVAFIAHHQSAEIAQPGEQALDLPAAAIAAQRAAILGLGTHPSSTMWRDHLDPQGGQGQVQPVGVIGAIANQALRELVDEARFERWKRDRQRSDRRRWSACPGAARPTAARRQQAMRQDATMNTPTARGSRRAGQTLLAFYHVTPPDRHSFFGQAPISCHRSTSDAHTSEGRGQASPRSPASKMKSQRRLWSMLLLSPQMWRERAFRLLVVATANSRAAAGGDATC